MTRAQLSLLGGIAPPRRVGVRMSVAFSGDPCRGCPREAVPVKVHPVLPPSLRLVAVGLAPGGDEEAEGVPFVGRSGKLLRSALREGGLGPEADVGYANLGRCRPEGDDFDTPEWRQAEDRCWSYLTRDLGDWAGPLLLLGSRPLQRFTGNGKASVRQERGLWKRLPDGRDAFIALHPAGVLRAGNTGAPERDRLEAQFRHDLRRMADRVLGRERFPVVQVTAFKDVPSAAKFLQGVARGQYTFDGHWFFDIETYDAKGSPSRPGVATDPFHPDFRVRGVAFGFRGDLGAWVEFQEGSDRAATRALLDPVFRSADEKGAFVSGFDMNGLIAQGWVSEVRNLTRDPWLAAVALDGKGGGHSLERLVVDVLGEPQPKAGVDRSRIREMSLEIVADYAVRDACCEWRLDAALQGRLERGEYL